MNKKVLIVEDQFVEANDLQLILCKSGYEVTGIARSVPIALEMIKKETPGIVILDIFLKGKLTGIDLARQLSEDNIAFVYLSANSNEEILSLAKTTEPQGFIVKPFREKDLLVTLEIAQYRHDHSLESRYRREKGLIQQLEKIVAAEMPWRERFLQIGLKIQQEIPFDYLTIGFDDPLTMAGRTISFLRIGFDEYQTIGLEEFQMISGVKMDQLVKNLTSSVKEKESAIFNQQAFEEITARSYIKKLIREKLDMQSMLSFPQKLENGEEFEFCFYSRRPDTYNTEHLALLHRLQQMLLKNFEEKPIVGDAGVKVEHHAMKEEVSFDNSAANASVFKGIIGNSHLLLNVFDLISKVGPTDTSVLILGESGTGKERVADCIHQLSPRRNKPIVKINCAAIPPTLIESELFGHEKGSFTGALDKRIGKFEKADKGTIFLDEIGEMTPDMQVKLLRVLQEKYIERIGANDITKIDVRIIAATNRKLEKEVAEGRFRLDLYYRLNVFPIELPPLRERNEDIPALAQHFIKYFNQKVGKKISGLSDKVLKKMTDYYWPGNIRELENVIERSILLSNGTILDELSLPIQDSRENSGNSHDFRVKTILENERDHILTILKKCRGRIFGSGGAAEVLNVPPTTLLSKMKKLGIEKGHID